MTKTNEQLFWEQFQANHSAQDRAVVRKIIDWAGREGLGTYPDTNGGCRSYLVNAERPILRIWARTGDGSGDIEIYFKNHYHNRERMFLFREESIRKDFLSQILAINTIETFGKPLAIDQRRNIKLSSFYSEVSLQRFFDVLQRVVREMSR